MKENIQQLLENTEKMEKIEEATEHLNDQAAAFQASSKDLATKMFWKKWKMRLLIGGIICIILVVIIVPIVISAQEAQKITDKNSCNTGGTTVSTPGPTPSPPSKHRLNVALLLSQVIEYLNGHK